MNHPRVLLIGGNPGRWSWNDGYAGAHVANGIEAWVFATQGTYSDHLSVTLDDVNRHDIVICNTNYVFKHRQMMKYIKLSEQRNSNVLWVSLLEGDMRDYMRPDTLIRRAFAASDLVNCINRHATRALQLVTDTPVAYIGIPYPVEGIQALSTPIQQRLRRVHVCAFLLRRWNDYVVAKQLGLPMDGYEGTMLRRIPNLYHNWKYYRTVLNKRAPYEIALRLYNDPEITVHRDLPMLQYFTSMGRNILWVNMDDRYTWGRYVLDAAALGVPIVTTRSTGHGSILFPDTTVETAFDVDDAVRQARQLLDDADYYAHVSNVAKERIWQYDAAHTVATLYRQLGV